MSDLIAVLSLFITGFFALVFMGMFFLIVAISANLKNALAEIREINQRLKL